MKESLQRERCFAYLLEDLDEFEKERFEVELGKNEYLEAELRTCSEELALFSEHASESKKPSAFVWARIEDELFGEKKEKPALIVLWWQRSPIWLAAACILLVLNLGLSFWSLKSGDGVSSAGSIKESEIALKSRSGGSHVSEYSSGNPHHIEDELVVMNERLVYLKKQLEVQNQIHDLEKGRIRELETERVLLASQIDELEREYLDLVGLDIPGSEEEKKEEVKNTDKSLKMLIAGFESSEGEALGANDLWERLDSMLPESGLAVLNFERSVLVGAVPNSRRVSQDFFYSNENFLGVVSYQANNNERIVPIPYLVSLLNDESNQAILSVGNLPLADDKIEYRVWNRKEEGEPFVEIGRIDRTDWRPNLNIAVQLSEGESLGEDFMISLENVDAEVEQPTHILISP